MADKKDKRKKKKKKHRVFWFFIKLQIFLMLIVLGGFGYYYFGGYADEIQQLKREAVQEVADSDDKIFIPSQTCFVYDTNGDLISERKGQKDAQYVKYGDIPQSFVTATISIEDKKFYQHNGVDFKGVVRAAKGMVEAKLKKTQSTQGGASTITMQLAKIMYMKPDRTWQYKVKQMFLAMELEKRYSKEKILEFYLNNEYFANGYYGIDAACHGYFDCELSELDISQVAFLCAIPNSPTYYDPVKNPMNTKKRRDRILKNMYEDGKITQRQYYEAVTEDITLNRPQESETDKLNNYVDTYTYYCAIRALMEQDGFEFKYYFDSEEEKEAYNEEYEELYGICQKKLYSGGYKIYTSLDMDKQKKLQKSVNDTLAGFKGKDKEGMHKMQGSAVCIDNDTGYVVAIVGGREPHFKTYTLNRAYQSHRQPGSSIKPLIVYTPQLERGYDPDTIVDDHKFEDGPTNANGGYAGKVPLRYAVAQSLNTVAWQLYEELTPTVGLQYLKNMNFSSIAEEDYVPATSLGGFTNGVSAVEMASAYAALENDGMYRAPTCVTSIVDSDENVVYTADVKEVSVYKKDAARTMTDILTTVMESGTGRRLKLKDMPCAGKTGTTNDHKDGWFCGFTRYYTTCVWVGYDYPKVLSNLSGNTYPGQIWNSFMSAVHEDLKPLDFLPYAKLSDEFVDEKEKEEDERDKRREENQITEDPDENNGGNNGDNNGDDENNDVPQEPDDNPDANLPENPDDNPENPDENQPENPDDNPNEPVQPPDDNPAEEPANPE